MANNTHRIQNLYPNLIDFDSSREQDREAKFDTNCAALTNLFNQPFESVKDQKTTGTKEKYSSKVYLLKVAMSMILGTMVIVFGILIACFLILQYRNNLIDFKYDLIALIVTLVTTAYVILSLMFKIACANILRKESHKIAKSFPKPVVSSAILVKITKKKGRSYESKKPRYSQEIEEQYLSDKTKAALTNLDALSITLMMEEEELAAEKSALKQQKLEFSEWSKATLTHMDNRTVEVIIREQNLETFNQHLNAKDEDLNIMARRLLELQEEVFRN